VIHELPALTGGFHVGVASWQSVFAGSAGSGSFGGRIGSRKVATRHGLSISDVVKAQQRRDRLCTVTPGARRSHTPTKLVGREAALRAQLMLRRDMTTDELRG
jgi:hypothetical protein